MTTDNLSLEPVEVTLKPCPNPWCISTTTPVRTLQSSGEWRVMCGCGVVTHRHKTEAEAITAWNTRPEAQSLPTVSEAPFDDGSLIGDLRRVEQGCRDEGMEEDADAVARAITALCAQPSNEAEGWRDIATFAEPTALSSGNGVLVAEEEGTVGEAYYRNYGDGSDGWWWANTSWGDYPEPDRPIPTRWRPLPAAPAALNPEGSDHAN